MAVFSYGCTSNQFTYVNHQTSELASIFSWINYCIVVMTVGPLTADHKTQEKAM